MVRRELREGKSEKRTGKRVVQFVNRKVMAVPEWYADRERGSESK